MQSCTQSLLNSDPSKICSLVGKYCRTYESIDYFELRYCTLGSPPSFYVLQFLIVVAGFYQLGSISDKYLTPIFTKLSDLLNLSETVAGVTLLAFANGAADIIASYTAGGSSDSGGVFISLGGLLGAGIFGGTGVLANCILKSKDPVKMSGPEWTRDLVFY